MRGLDSLMKKVKEAERVAKALDGDFACSAFDPQDPQSIEIAIKNMEQEIDSKAGSYSSSNELVRDLIASLKEQGRQAIIERAEAFRAEAKIDE